MRGLILAAMVMTTAFTLGASAHAQYSNPRDIIIYGGADILARAIAQAKLDCDKGAPPNPRVSARVASEAVALMERYTKLTQRPDGQEFRRLFTLNDRRASWQTPNQQPGRQALLARLAALSSDPAAAPPTIENLPPPLVLFVSGDGQSARGLWDLSAPPTGANSGNDGPYYLVDFHHTRRGLKILTLRIVTLEVAVPALQQACRYNGSLGTRRILEFETPEQRAERDAAAAAGLPISPTVSSPSTSPQQ